MISKKLLGVLFGATLLLNGCAKPEDNAEACADGKDNDKDDLVDCADDECAAFCIVDECVTPNALTDPANNVAGDSTGNNDSADGSCLAAATPDVVFSVTPTKGILSITVTPDAAATDLDLAVAVQTTCGDAASELDCQDSGFGGDPEQTDVTVTPGQPVFIVVSGFDVDDIGAFTISVASRDIVCGDNIAEGNEVCDGTDLGFDDCTTQPGGFVGGTLACSAGCDTFVTTGCTLPICGDGLIDGAEECDDNNTADTDGCSANCTVEAGFICSGEPSVCANVNAICATATPLVNNITGDTTNGTDVFDGSCTGGGKEILFSFTPQAANVSITVTPGNANTDPGLYALTTCNDINSEIDCSDSGAGGDPDTLALTGLTIGTPITIVVDSFFDGDEGPFTLTIQ